MEKICNGNITITAGEYFSSLLFIYNQYDNNYTQRYRQLLQLTDHLCRQLLPRELPYPGLFESIEEICRDNDEAYRLLTIVRVHTHQTLFSDSYPPNERELKKDIYRFARAVGILLNVSVPMKLQGNTEDNDNITKETPHDQKITRIRASFRKKLTDGKLSVVFHDSTDTSQRKISILPHKEYQDIFCHSIEELEKGMQVNLINVKPVSIKDREYTCEMIVIEPDILLDISAVSECFKEYGVHPLSYFLFRLGTDKNTHHILLGNIANLFLDELVNESEGNEISFEKVMQKAFRQNPFGIAACPDLQDKKTEKEFFNACRLQFRNLKDTVQRLFSEKKIDRNKVLLEPTFICESLGLQGRLDLLSDDLSAFIELKSGKAKEDVFSGTLSYGESHYVQMLLYAAVLHFNLGIEYGHTHPYLLYSRYPTLYPMGISHRLIKEAVNLRNRIVAQEYRLQKMNSPVYSRDFLYQITPDALNIRHLVGTFWDKYLSRPIDNFATLLRRLSPIANDYFSTLFTFICKEQYLSRTGSSQYDNSRGLSSLWNSPIDEKIASGEMIPELFLSTNRMTEKDQILTFRLPHKKNEYDHEPNFRKGDMVILYLRNTKEANACNRQIFKGCIENISSDSVTISLRIRQRNQQVLPLGETYALERDYPDVGFSIMYRALGYFLQANGDRRDLLLSQRAPRTDENRLNKILQKEENDLNRTVEKALAAQDYFLLIGPPGTGKTSQALKRIVIEYLKKDKDILLLAYTHKAVDEICNTLIDIDPELPFLRLGNKTSCDPSFHYRLLDEALTHCYRRSDVTELISNCHIIVSTLTTLCGRMDLFKIKHFDAAIIDEASQILEPQFIGIWCATDSYGNNAIDKFILIGDHKQLPAVVMQSKEQSEVTSERLQNAGINNLQDSLFERLYRYQKEKYGPNSLFAGHLTRQGRMHPDICDFPSITFYEGKLLPIPLKHQQQKDLPFAGSENEYMNRILSRRFAFVSIKSEISAPDYKINRKEAVYITRLAKAVYHRIIREKGKFDASCDIGIITPYRSQIAAIKHELSQTGIDELSRLTIDTVERFQGGQRDVILFSCCINSPFQLRFICNTFEENGNLIDRKLNVALTRAREQMIIIGNSDLLQRNIVYRKLLEYINNKESLFKEKDPTF